MDRRDFVATVGGTALSATPGLRPGSVRRPRPAADRPMVGIQVGAVSFVDEGTEQVLDGFQELAAINTLFLATFTYGRGIAGRQPRGQPLPDHGAQAYDDDFRGGNFATPHPQYYRDTSIVPEKAPDHPGYDVIADVLPAARRRGMRLYCWFEDVFRRDVPGFDRAAEIDLHGKPTGLACHRNPNTRTFWLGLAEDYLRSYDVDGLMWGSERQGPLDNALAASHGGGGSGVACFCPHCLDAARKAPIAAARGEGGERAQGPARQPPRREPWRRWRGGRLLLPPLSRRGPQGRDRRRPRAGGVSRARALGHRAACRTAAQRRGVRDLLAFARQVSRAAGVGAAVERGAERHLPRSVSARRARGPRQRHRLAHLAQQLVFAVLSGRAGLRRVREVLGLPESRDVQQLRRPAPGAVRAQRARHAVCRPDAGASARFHVWRATVSRAAARSHRDGGPLGRLRAARDAARRGRGGAPARELGPGRPH